VISPEQFETILAAVRDQEFKDLLTVSWETGCRPQESLRVEARHVDRDNARWVFPASEAKGGRLPRVVYLTPEALAVTERLMVEHPAGPLFGNTDGLPWTADAANCRFRRVAIKTGVHACLYAQRHTWMNRLLMSGVDALTVAVLAGHSDPSTLAKYYRSARRMLVWTVFARESFHKSRLHKSLICHPCTHPTPDTHRTAVSADCEPSANYAV